MSKIGFLETLENIIRERMAEPTQGSYTATLAAAGVRRMAQKVGEEGVEVALAAAAGDRDELLDESADLIYHLLVLLNANNVELADAVARLAERHADRN